MATKRWISTSSTDFQAAGNWSDGAVPADNDEFIFDGQGTANVSTNLANPDLTGVTVIVYPAYTGQIGSVSGSTVSYLSFNSATLRMPRDQSGSVNAGSQRVMMATTAGSTTFNAIIETSNSTGADLAYPPVCLKASGSMSLTVSGGVVGVAVRPGETTTLASLRVTRGAGAAPKVYLGSGVTLTDAVVDAGDVYSRTSNTCAAIRLGGGNYEYTGTGAHTTINVDAGTMTYSGTGTVTTLNLRGTADFSRDPRAKTVTTLNTYRGSVLNLDNGVPGGVTITNAINHYDGIGPGGCQLTTPAYVESSVVILTP